VQVLNWGRLSDGIIDTAFEQIRGNSDPAVRKKASEAISRQLGETASILWRWRGRFHLSACARCGGLEDIAGPENEKIANSPSGHFQGAAWLTAG
jgi:hypothetical protein